MPRPAELLIEHTEPSEEREPTPFRYEISSYPTDFTVRVMYEKWMSEQLIIPNFQRKFVWTLPQASRLIESFLMGLPIPQVFLYKERGSPDFLVVDGQQRLASIAAFYTGRLKDRIFKLTGVAPRWEGMTYDQLDEDDRKQLDDSTLRSIVIQQLDPDDNSSIYRIFERLNTGGTQLQPMEIRKAVFHGPIFETLERANEEPAWRSILGTAEPDNRLRDVELIVRILSLATSWEEYKKPMKTFLTEFLSGIKEGRQVDHSLDRLESDFRHATASVIDGLGPKPFHLRVRLNVAALDSIIAGTIIARPSPERLAQAWALLREDPEFSETVTHNTSDVDVLRRRFGLVLGRLAR